MFNVWSVLETRQVWETRPTLGTHGPEQLEKEERNIFRIILGPKRGGERWERTNCIGTQDLLNTWSRWTRTEYGRQQIGRKKRHELSGLSNSGGAGPRWWSRRKGRVSEEISTHRPIRRRSTTEKDAGTTEKEREDGEISEGERKNKTNDGV